MNDLRKSTAGARPPCRFCGAPVGVLDAWRGNVCGQMRCRRLATDEITRGRRERQMAHACADASRAWDAPALAGAPVLWLVHHAVEMVERTETELDEMRAFLMTLEGKGPDDEPLPPELTDDPPAGSAAAAADARLCTLCEGRCCRHGRRFKAFLTSRQLRAWVIEQAEATWSDAVDHYLAHAPERHLDGGCLFQGERGCTLPRERRSEVCNGYACDPLIQLREHLTEHPGALVAVGIVGSHEVRRAGVVSAGELRVLPLPSPSLDPG